MIGLQAAAPLAADRPTNTYTRQQPKTFSSVASEILYKMIDSIANLTMNNKKFIDETKSCQAEAGDLGDRG